MALERRCLLAAVLISLALPARAEVVTLLCKIPNSEGSFTLRVDYDRKMVADVHPNGNSGTFVAATITEGNITWDHVFQNVEVFKGQFGRFRFAGALNRLSGQGSVTYDRMDTNQPAWTLNGLCSPAAKRF
jgi:hypothetical protein